MQSERLIEKINSLPPDMISEVEGFVDSLIKQSKRLSKEERRQVIIEYALAVGSTKDDLDTDIQEVSLEHLAEQEKEEW